MLKQLRRKFIWINMLLVSLVLLIVFGVLLGTTSQRLRGQSMNAMHMALKWSEDAPPPRVEIGLPEMGLEGRKERDHMNRQTGVAPLAMVPTFCVTADESGAILSSTLGGNIQVSDEALQRATELAAQQVQDKGLREGSISSLHLRFLAEKDRGGSLQIAFADLGWERESLSELVLTSLLVGAVALVCFFGVSLFLSSVALRPVEKAWEQQRQFVADASHELKTPLTVILANVGIVLDHREDPVRRQEKWLSYIQEEGKRMKELLEDMLFLAKTDAAQQSLTLNRISISDLVMGCLLPFESVAFESGVQLEGEISPNLSMQGDEQKLRRLVMILLDNAVKYAGEGGIVTLKLSGHGDKVRLSIQNTGDPIPPEHLAHLFERFYRVDSARSRDRGGYGLGLAIAQTIVRSHGGKLSVTSMAEQGTIFTAVLPSGQRGVRGEPERKSLQ